MTPTQGKFPLKAFTRLETPFYYYDLDVLRQTLTTLKNEAQKNRVNVHYAIKANANPRILSMIQMYGLGIDCVSGGEIRAALKAGVPADKIVFAGVGKSDWEINLALEAGIFCFNVESLPELEVIAQLAAARSVTAPVALRINPDVQADTHHYIATGMKENKFGINLGDVDAVIDRALSLPQIRLVGLHFHIGSQILEMNNFAGLCSRVNEIQDRLARRNLMVEHINLGGGLGVDYHHPDQAAVPDFAEYFSTIRRMLRLRPGQSLHVEPGRSVVAQCGSLISKVLYVKQGSARKFAILDAGMTELIRPALYQAYHKIENISSDEDAEKYDVVGPICESSDCFGKEVTLNRVRRGDYIAVRSAGAYGETMSSNYNLRPTPKSYFSDDLI
ncbi:MAG: diaminopimelate decarboxylase [Bacteroidales bacterium]|nr:diaminopimelate decarboxylase [Bacteroidales bacterium]